MTSWQYVDVLVCHTFLNTKINQSILEEEKRRDHVDERKSDVFSLPFWTVIFCFLNLQIQSTARAYVLKFVDGQDTWRDNVNTVNHVCTYDLLIFHIVLRR